MYIQEATPKDLPLIQDLAQQTWFSTYTDILAEAQMQYMFEQMYSLDNLQAQMQTEQHQFIIAWQNELPQGYASYQIINLNTIKIHKIYVVPQVQAKGIGRLMLQYIEQKAKENDVNILMLNVNRHNKARFFYEKLGFNVVQIVDIPIGEGFYMNDFVMQKVL